MRYFLCPGKPNMSKGINSQCEVVHDRLGHDVRLGDVFIFINRSRTTMKLLHAEDGGMLLYMKRLGRGYVPAAGIWQPKQVLSDEIARYGHDGGRNQRQSEREAEKVKSQ